MDYYCISCQCGIEKKFCENLKSKLEEYPIDNDSDVIFPVKIMHERKKGTWKEVEQSLIPGYVILSTDLDILKICEICYGLKGYRYPLRYGDKTFKLRDRDLEYALWVSKNDGVILPSKAVWVPGEKIKIIEGPLKDFTGSIKKIFKRGHKLTVNLDFAGCINTVSLAVEFVEPLKEKIDLSH